MSLIALARLPVSRCLATETMRDLPVLPTPVVPRSSQPTAGEAGPWRLSQLASAPHRLGFSAAALLLGVTALWWMYALFAPGFGWSISWAVPPLVAHGAIMSLGFMPLFIVGFLFTAGPKWLNAAAVPVRTLLVPVALLVMGLLLAIAGFHIAGPVAGFGFSVAMLGWGYLVWRFAVLWQISTVPDRFHAGMVLIACALGLVAMVVLAVGLFTESAAISRAGNYLAIWGFLAPVFATVSHRMIPFFSALALPAVASWRPNPLLWIMIIPLWLHGLVGLLELQFWPLPTTLQWALVGVELPAGIVLIWLAWQWGLLQSLKIRLLLMLHAGFVWLGISLVLSAVSQAMMLVTDGALSLGLAPLHALTIGYMGATMVAMITRVAAGHSGRSLTADNFAWTLYWCVQLTAALRIAAELVPPLQRGLTLAAVVCWAFAAIGWAVRYTNWFGRARIDGRPG